MAIPITIPRLGWNMDEGVFAGWLKRDGEAVRAGDPLYSLEGDKATQEVEAIDPGIVRIAPTAPGVGDRIPVGARIGYILQPGEAIPSDLTTPDAGARTEADPLRAPGLPEVQPAERRAGRDGPRSSPLARRIARELGIDWTRLLGSGHAGRVRKVDVLEAARVGSETARTAPPLPATERTGPGRSIPVGTARRTIAARMLMSRQATAPVTLTTTVDATNLVNLRRQFKEAGPPGRVVPGITDFVVKLTALALREHPLLNARWADDRIEVPGEAHIGIAVDTEAGLFVPVIRGAGGLGLGQIAERTRDLIARARENRLRWEEMEGGTFTVTNLGAFGIEAFTPIINPPECAILGVGRIQRQPVMDGERVVGRERVVLSLTFDHRIVDGAPAARFLQALGQLIENPGPWLIS